MIKFMAFGDLHYDEIPDGDRRIDELLAHIGETNPDFVISLGDLCKPSSDNQEAVLKKLRSAGVPLYHMIGNHETDECHLEKVMKFYSLEKPYYSFEYEDIKFIVLDSCFQCKGNKESPYYNRNYKDEMVLHPVIPSDETEWLKKELEDQKKYFIFSHHSLVNQFKDRGIHNQEKIRELFRDKKVLLCMNGHDHGDDLKFVDDIPYYTINSAAYVWCGCQITNEEKLKEKYADLNGFLLYRQALCVNVEIDDNEIRILGMDGEYLSVTPADVGLHDYRWNGVSIKPRTSSCVIKIK